MAAANCSECGAKLEVGPITCPLCGADVADRSTNPTPASLPVPVDTYQSNVRKLREELRKLRDAEAV